MSTLVQYTVQGLAAGSFYALAALGLAIIFGVLGIVNFAHGAFYMLGAVTAAVLLGNWGISLWWALLIVPLLMFVLGVVVERTLVRWLLPLDPLYNFLLTLGVAMVCVELVKQKYGVSGLPYQVPHALRGRVDALGAVLPRYQLFVFVLSLIVCVLVWLLMTRTRVGMIVRASTERPDLARALGINVGRWVTPVFGFGVALAGLAGVMSAPFRAITADMGTNFIIILFSVVVIGGLGSIFGAVAAGFVVGLVEAFGQAYAPTYSQILIFVLMAAVVLFRPAGLFGREELAR
jgi:branched-chain amino acid transport system permease protein